MGQAKITFEPSQVEFLKAHKKYGFKDKSSLVREALKRFQEELKKRELETSAQLYAEVYTQDADLRELTDSAIEGWPE